jgi:serine/threonine protein kinase
MKSRIASVRAAGGLDRVDRVVQLLEDEWQRCGKVQLERFWTQEYGQSITSADALGLLAELIKVDLRCRFERGETPTAAAYFELFPELRAAHSNVLSLVYEEYCLHEERGAEPDVESFCNRYPEWKSSLVSQLRYHHNLSQLAGGKPSLPPFPAVGDDFLEFRLKAPLGKGGVSRVYLARDLSLGGKQVVLKVTLDRGQEPKVHGPLDHPHIVPVNSVVYEPKDNLRGLSMPYRPGLPLDQLIKLTKPEAQPKNALVLWKSLVAGTRDSNLQLDLAAGETEQPGSEGLMVAPKGDGWEGFPVRGSYAQGVAWIVMILARALHYAHRMKTYHRDVKPGNVLLTLQHGPQLLDFNLAESPHSIDNAQLALHGGTLPYMAPEQIEAFINPDLWDKVGARADIYSLGLVLRELLTGKEPEIPDQTLPPARALRSVLDSRSFLAVDVRRFNPSIPHSLQAIVAKCLALSPEARYSDAEALERDLDRFLRYQPLKDAGNPSRREQVDNWVMRNRRVLAKVACTVVLGAMLYGLWQLRPNTRPSGPGIETSSEFKHALDALNADDLEPAVDALGNLNKKDPRSPHVKLYLSLGLDGLARKQIEDKNSKAPEDSIPRPFNENNLLRDALALPEAESKLLEWAAEHKEVFSYLVEFADSRIQYADAFNDKWDLDNPGRKDAMPDDERDAFFLTPKYGPAKNALLLAERLDAKPSKVQRLLARTELVLAKTPEHYLTAHVRLSRVIRSILSVKDLAADELDELYDCRTLRSEVAFRWAELERKARAVSEETLNRMREAVRDLNKCAQHLNNSPFVNFDEDAKRKYETAKRKYHHHLHDRLRATVTLAEVEIDLNDLQNGKKHLGSSKSILDELVEYTTSNDLTGKVPATGDLEKRIENGKSRLQGMGIASSRSSLESLPKAGRAGHESS